MCSRKRQAGFRNVLFERKKATHLVHLPAAEVLEGQDEGLGQAVGQGLLRVGNLLQRAPEPGQQRLQIYSTPRSQCEEPAECGDGIAFVPLSVSKVALRLDAAVWLARAIAREACPMDIVALHKSFIPCTAKDAQTPRLDVSIASRMSGESANSP